jgi:HTH-type transcriptional regulator / antitoxin HipB
MPTQINSIRDLAAVARGRRLDLGLSQSELAARARVSRQWISEFESGKATAELGLVIRLLDALGLRLDVDERGDGRGGDQPPRRGTVDLDALLDDYRER